MTSTKVPSMMIKGTKDLSNILATQRKDKGHLGLGFYDQDTSGQTRLSLTLLKRLLRILRQRLRLENSNLKVSEYVTHAISMDIYRETALKVLKKY